MLINFQCRCHVYIAFKKREVCDSKQGLFRFTVKYVIKDVSQFNILMFDSTVCKYVRRTYLSLKNVLWGLILVLIEMIIGVVKFWIETQPNFVPVPHVRLKWLNDEICIMYLA